MECIVIYDNINFKIINCVGVKDCVKQLAESFGENTGLFQKGLKGCESPEDCVAMFNLFSSHQINHIYELYKTIYNSED